MGRLISILITWALIFMSLGTLGQMTMQVMGLAAKSTQSGLISLMQLNSELNRK